MVKKRINLMREFSIPLLAGAGIALLWANLAPAGYSAAIHRPWLGSLSFYFLSNDLFMVLFFGIAAAEITQSCQAGGDLYPLRQAGNPLLASLGGVLGPALVYLVGNHWFGSPSLANGWGIPTATDIALSWLVARLVFGSRHPVISYLLLLAIVDDGIGLAIIAIFYPDPAHPIHPAWLLLTGAGMVAAYLARRLQVRSYWPYLLGGGILSWVGLYRAHLHPALALVFIVPFLPPQQREAKQLFVDDPRDRSAIAQFVGEWKVVVDFGLFMFGLANAGVVFAEMAPVTFLVLGALVVGKTAGVFCGGCLGEWLGYPLPARMGKRELLVTGMVSAIGFTVALFVAGEAFVEPRIQGAAKMGAALSVGAAFLSWAMARLLGVRRIR